MTYRQRVLDVVKRMPDDSSPAAIIEKVEFVLGVQEAIEEVERGEVYTLEEVEAWIKSWSSTSSPLPEPRKISMKSAST